MSVSTTHPTYNEMLITWEKMRDTIGGTRLIKSRARPYTNRRQLSGPTSTQDFAGERYLRRRHNQDPDMYELYRENAIWLDATGRTLQFYLSLIFRKPVRIEVDGEQLPSKEIPVGMKGEDLHTFCETLMQDYLSPGRIGLMVDTTDDGTPRTVAEREAAGVGAYLTWYHAESVINWRYGVVNGREQLTMVVLAEDTERAMPQDEFSLEVVRHYRVLRLEEGGATVEVLNEDNEVVEPRTPIMDADGQLQEIPFRLIVASPTDNQPPLEGIAEINLGHYRNSAWYENALLHAGSPTPFLAGWTGETGQIHLGSNRALVDADPQFRASYLEFHGHGLNGLQEALNDKRRDMANLGARLLMDTARFNEAAETVLMRKAGEASVIQQLVDVVNEAMTWAMRLFYRFEGRRADVKVRLNRDLLPASMSHQMVVALMNLQISGNLSKRALFERLKDGEIVDAEESYEKVRAEIEEDQEAEMERMMDMPNLIGRHADRSLPNPGDANNEHGQGVTPARGN